MAARLSACLLFACAVLSVQPAAAVTLDFGEVLTLRLPIICPDKAGALVVVRKYQTLDPGNDATFDDLVKTSNANHCEIPTGPIQLAIDGAAVFDGKMMTGALLYVVPAASIRPPAKGWLILKSAKPIVFAKPDKPAHWGATAAGRSADRAAVGGATDQPLPGQAIDAAEAACEAKGVPACRAVTIYNNGCGYVTFGTSPNGFRGRLRPVVGSGAAGLPGQRRQRLPGARGVLQHAILAGARRRMVTPARPCGRRPRLDTDRPAG